MKFAVLVCCALLGTGEAYCENLRSNTTRNLITNCTKYKDTRASSSKLLVARSGTWSSAFVGPSIWFACSLDELNYPFLGASDLCTSLCGTDLQCKGFLVTTNNFEILWSSTTRNPIMVRSGTWSSALSELSILFTGSSDELNYPLSLATDICTSSYGTDVHCKGFLSLTNNSLSNLSTSDFIVYILNRSSVRWLMSMQCEELLQFTLIDHYSIMDIPFTAELVYEEGLFVQMRIRNWTKALKCHISFRAYGENFATYAFCFWLQHTRSCACGARGLCNSASSAGSSVADRERSLLQSIFETVTMLYSAVQVLLVVSILCMLLIKALDFAWPCKSGDISKRCIALSLMVYCCYGWFGSHSAHSTMVAPKMMQIFVSGPWNGPLCIPIPALSASARMVKLVIYRRFGIYQDKQEASI